MKLQPNQRKIHMYIAGEEIVCNSNFTIVEELKNPNTIILNNCYPLSWEEDKDYVSNFYMPKDYSLFRLTYDYSGFDLTTERGEEILTEAGQTIEAENSEVTVFVGVVKRNKPVSLNPNHPHYNTLQVLDFKTFLSEGDLFNFVVEETTIGEFLNKVIREYSGYNFILGDLSTFRYMNDTIRNYSCDQKTLYDVLEYVCQITESVWRVRYINDTTFAIDFLDLRFLPSGVDLQYKKKFWDDNSIVDIAYNFDTTDYRNKQVMTAPNIISKDSNIEEFYTDSNNGEYKLSNNVGWITQAFLGDFSLSLGTEQDQQNGFTIDLCYTEGSNVIKLNYDSLPTQKLTVIYYPMLPGRVTAFNTKEIQRIGSQLDNVGIISRYEQRKDTTSAEELNQIAQYYIRYKGKPNITLQVKTLNNDLWEVGQRVYFSTNLNVNGLDDLNTSYAIKKKTIQQIQNNADNTSQIFYTYEMSNNYNFENLVNYFDNQRAKTIGNIQEGQFINKYIENTEAINIIFDEPVIGGA